MKTYEEMTENVMTRVHSYEAAQKQKRAKITKIAAASLPVCAAAAVGIGLWSGGKPEQPQTAPVSSVTEAAASPVTTEIAAETPAESGTTAIAKAKAPAETQHTEIALNRPGETEPGCIVTGVTVPAPEQPIGTSKVYSQPDQTEPSGETVRTTPAMPPQNSSMMFLPEGTDPDSFQYEKCVSSYAMSGSFDYPAPKDGTVTVSMSLKYALDENGSSAKYLIRADVFAGDGTKRVMEHDALYAEAKRLSDLGYTVAFEGTSEDGGKTFLYSLSVLFAAEEQVRSFPGSAQYGYFLRLYNSDANGNCTGVPDQQVTFHGGVNSFTAE